MVANTPAHKCICTSENLSLWIVAYHKLMFKKQAYTAWLSEPGLKMPAYTKCVNKSIKLFKRSTTSYTKADNTLHLC